MHPPPHHPHEAGWLYNYVKDLPLAEGLKSLAKIVGALSERGKVKLGKETVTPPETARFTIRYEQAPRGEKMKLKLEIEWEQDGETADSSDGPEIEEID